MRFVRPDGDELDIQLEGRLVRVDGVVAGVANPSRVTRFESVDEAVAAHAEAIAAARRDGYVDAADPFVDDDARLVYADALQLRGDPLGELVTIAHELAFAGTDEKQRKRAENRLATLLDDQHDRWFGALARLVRKPSRKAPALPNVEVRWRLGFAEDVTVRGTRAMQLHEAYALLAALPLARQIRRLVVGDLSAWGPYESTPVYGKSYVRAFEGLLEHGIPSRLRELVVGEESEAAAPVVYLPGLADVVDAARSLERLHVVTGTGSLAIASTSLSSLEWRDIEGDQLGTLSEAKLPALRELTLHVRTPQAPLRVVELFPTLEALALDSFVRRPGDTSLLDELGDALGSLRTLALPNCRLDDRDLVTLIRDAPRFARLTRIDLRHNTFSRHLARTAKRALSALRFG